MAYTSFGEYMRILRIKHHQVMGDVAKILNTSTPFLSAVENGKKNVPAEWVQKIIDYYKLTVEEQRKLIDSIEESKLQYKIIPGKAGINQRKAAMQFARSFDEMDDETALKILELLRDKEGDD
jgi:transcriptional regulator with XRE-family HTH domain